MPLWQPPPIARCGAIPSAGSWRACARALAERLGVDPLLLRVAFVPHRGRRCRDRRLRHPLVAAAGGRRRPRAAPRAAPPRPGQLARAAGVALLTLSGLLVLRQLGLWFSDAIVWPVVLAAAGVALAWRLSGPPADQTMEESGAAEAGAPAATERRRRPAGCLPRRLRRRADRRGGAALPVRQRAAGGPRRSGPHRARRRRRRRADPRPVLVAARRAA